MCRQLSTFWQSITIDRLPTSSAHINTQLFNALLQAWKNNTQIAGTPVTLFAGSIGQLGTAIVSIFRSDIHPLPKMIHGGQGVTALALVIVTGMMLAEGLSYNPTDYTGLNLAYTMLSTIILALITFGSLIVDNPNTPIAAQTDNPAAQGQALAV